MVAKSKDLRLTYGIFERIGFIDGQILSANHLALLQENIGSALKLQSTQDKYDMLILVSPYEFYIAEPFLSDDRRDSSSTAMRDKMAYTINDGIWVTPFYELPERANSFAVFSTYYDNHQNGSSVKFYYRTVEEGDWEEMVPDYEVKLAASTSSIQIKIECSYMISERPEVKDFAVFFK